MIIRPKFLNHINIHYYSSHHARRQIHLHLLHRHCQNHSHHLHFQQPNLFSSGLLNVLTLLFASSYFCAAFTTISSLSVGVHSLSFILIIIKFSIVLWTSFGQWSDIKVCVCYIFASLFCMSKREHWINKEKWFLFHFQSSFRSWDTVKPV